MEREEIKDAVREAMREEMKAFYIDRETHYLDHKFLKSLREFMDGCQSTAVKTVVTAMILFVLGGIGLAVYFMKGPFRA